MKKLFIPIVLISLLTGYQNANAQEMKFPWTQNKSYNTEKLQEQKEIVKAKETEKLTEEIKEINEKLKSNKISEQEAEDLKKAAADRHAKNIEDQLDIIDANIALINRNKIKEEDDNDYTSILFLSKARDTIKKDTVYHRTHSGPILGFGLNNAIGPNQSIDDSPYRIGGSRFFEMGYEFRTALFKNGFLRVNYGVSFQFNSLKPTGNRYFVVDSNETVLEDFSFDLKKSKLRLNNIVIPVYFEIGPTNGRFYANKFKFGVGGYVGANLSTIQKLKYFDDGKKMKNKIEDDYNTNKFIYGVGAYIGYEWFALYAKYDFNTIFKDNPIETHNVSVGIRVMF